MLTIAWMLALAAPAWAEDEEEPATAEEASAEASTVRRCEDAIEDGKLPDALKRVVRLSTEDGGGSGVMISPDGVVATAAHVVATVDRVDVYVGDDDKREGMVVKRAPESDLALVRVMGSEYACLALATEDPEVGSDIVAVGNPGGEALSMTVTRGIVSGIRMKDDVPIVQTDAAINFGNSGGPLLDDERTVVGIVSFKAVGEAEGLAFAISARGLPEALDFTFGDKTSGDLETIAPAAPVMDMASLMPRIEPGAGVTIPRSVRFEQKYRPKSKAMGILSIVGMGVGLGLVGATSANRDEPRPPSAWGARVALNTTGWVTTGLGAGGLLFFLPSRGGDVVKQDAP